MLAEAEVEEREGATEEEEEIVTDRRVAGRGRADPHESIPVERRRGLGLFRSVCVGLRVVFSKRALSLDFLFQFVMLR